MKWFVYCLHRKEINGVDEELVVWRCNSTEWFHSRGQQQLCQFTEKKESFNIKITVSIPEYWFGKRTRPLIYYFTTPIWPGCDVMWKLSISTVRCHNALSLNPTKSCRVMRLPILIPWIEAGFCSNQQWPLNSHLHCLVESPSRLRRNQCNVHRVSPQSKSYMSC